MVKLLTGLERYIVERSAKKLLEGIEESEISVIEGKFDVTTIKKLADMTSIFSERKGILARCRNLSANDLKAVKELADKYNANDVVIVVVCETITNGTGILKELGEINQRFDKYTEKDMEKLVQFICRWAGEQGVKVTRSAAQELVRRSDYFGKDEVNLFTIELLVEQVSLLGDITDDTVKEAIADTPAAKAYQLIDYLVKHDGKGLVENAHKILESRESTEIGLLQLLAKPFRLAWLEHVVGTGSTGAKNYTFEKVIRLSDDVLEQCADIIDRRIQDCMGGLKPRVAFDLAVAELIETV